MLLDEHQIAECEVNSSRSSTVGFVVLRTEYKEHNERDIVGIGEFGSFRDGTIVADFVTTRLVRRNRHGRGRTAQVFHPHPIHDTSSWFHSIWCLDAFESVLQLCNRRVLVRRGRVVYRGDTIVNLWGVVIFFARLKFL